MSIRFSVVIPTREGRETLAGTIATCLAQEFANAEFVVSDNCSSPETKAVVDRFDDPRLCYVRSETPLSMTDSWEFAVGHAGGEYVLLIGDDDGLLQHCLKSLDAMMTELNNPKILRWDAAIYHWPDISAKSHRTPNELFLPLKKQGHSHPVVYYPARERMVACVDGDISYDQLPNFYCSAIHQSVISELRSRTGRVFRSRTPDVYGAFAFAFVAGGYHSLASTLTVCGMSGKSNGIARHAMKGDSPITREFDRLNQQAGWNQHPTVPELPPIAAAVADAFMQLKAQLFADDVELSFDRPRLVERCLAELHCDTNEEWQRALSQCRDSLKDDPALLNWFDETVAPRGRPETPPNARELRYGGDYLRVNGDLFGLRGIDDAMKFAEKLLGYCVDGTPIAMTERETEARTPLYELQQKELLIQQQHQAILAQQAALREMHGIAEERLNLLLANQQALQANQQALEQMRQVAEDRLVIMGDLERDLKQSLVNIDRLFNQMNKAG